MVLFRNFKHYIFIVEKSVISRDLIPFNILITSLKRPVGPKCANRNKSRLHFSSAEIEKIEKI